MMNRYLVVLEHNKINQLKIMLMIISERVQMWVSSDSYRLSLIGNMKYPEIIRKLC